MAMGNEGEKGARNALESVNAARRNDEMNGSG